MKNPLHYLAKTHGATCISPSQTNKHIETLLDILDAEYDPEQVQVKIEKYAKEKNCYINVAEKIKRDGGKLINGWVVWQSKYLLEAEHHAVWLNDDGEEQIKGEINGELICITPRERKYTSIMFIPDIKAVYDGNTSIDNIRINISGNPIIDDYIELIKTREALYATGTRINDDQVAITNETAKLIEIVDLEGSLTELFFLQGGKMEKLCFCPSGKTYADCHHTKIAALPQAVENTKKNS